MLLRLFLLPLRLIVGLLRSSHNRGGALAVVITALVLIGLGVAPWFFGVGDAFHVGIVLGIIMLFPYFWGFDWLFGLAHLAFHANVFEAIARLLHG